jgi:hypothetical protein
MTNDKSRVTGPIRTNDGHKPSVANDGYPGKRGHQPGVQGGYQSPGGARPPLPTTGSGVKPPPTSKKD